MAKHLDPIDDKILACKSVLPNKGEETRKGAIWMAQHVVAREGKESTDMVKRVGQRQPIVKAILADADWQREAHVLRRGLLDNNDRVSERTPKKRKEFAEEAADRKNTLAEKISERMAKEKAASKEKVR